jgi:hypothetical protein
MTNDQSGSASPGKKRNNPYVNISGCKITDFPDGSQLIEGLEGDKYIIAENGEVSATMPEIRQIQIDSLADVARHDIVTFHDTVSHTLHFAGGGVFSYLHNRNGLGISLEWKRMTIRPLGSGVILVSESVKA